MRPKSGPEKQRAEGAIRDIRRATRRHFLAEEKIRIVLEGLRGEKSLAELCRHEGIASSMYFGWPKEFLEAGKRRLAGDTARAVNSDDQKPSRIATHGRIASGTESQGYPQPDCRPFAGSSDSQEPHPA